MKKLFPSILVNICMLLAGILFIFVSGNPDVLNIVAIILGFVFIIPSLVYLCLVLFQKKEERNNTSTIGLLPAAGGLCFGVVLIVHPEIFNHALSIVFSILLIALGLFHIIYNAMSAKSVDIKPWAYIAPVLIAIAGVVTLLLSKNNQSLLILLTGISLILSAFATATTYHAERKAMKAANAPKAIEGKKEEQ